MNGAGGPAGKILSYFVSGMAVVCIVLLASPAFGTPFSLSHLSEPVPVVHEGQGEPIIAPHHTPQPPGGPPPGPHAGHYFAQTGDLHHFAWFNLDPATSPGVSFTIKYDFRTEGGFSNDITAGQQARAVDALSAWSAATFGRIVFVQDTGADREDIINIGTGDLAALGFTSGPGGTLALGGGFFNHGAGAHEITEGVAWQDKDETWDEIIGNGNPAGTFDYFTVVAQEVGHALGLGHTNDVPDPQIMDGTYIAEQTAFSTVDIDHIQSVYGLLLVPEPNTLILVGSGLLVLEAWRAGRKRTRVS